MQQSLPKFVEAIRISDIGQGTNPFRIVSMRALPDQPGEKEYPREEWIDQGTNALMDQANPQPAKDEKATDGKDMDQAGDYVVCTTAVLSTGCSPDTEFRSLVCIPGYARSRRPVEI